MNTIPIYVINLRRVPERRLYMQRQLDYFGLKYQWINAVDAHDFKYSELEGLDLKDQYQPSAMACLLSHLKSYSHIIQNNHQVACILEDDAELLPDFADILNHKELHEQDWEILLLAHNSSVTYALMCRYYRYCFNPISKAKIANTRVVSDATALGALTKNAMQKRIQNYYMAEPQGYSDVTMPTLAMAYLIKLSAAKKLREIAIDNQKSIYADDITGCANSFGVSQMLITPPCININPIYLKYSSIYSQERKYEQTSEKTNMYADKLPDKKLLQLYMRNRWKALAISVFRLKIGLCLCFLLTLMSVWKDKIRQYLTNKTHPRRLHEIRQR